MARTKVPRKLLALLVASLLLLTGFPALFIPASAASAGLMSSYFTPTFWAYLVTRQNAAFPFVATADLDDPANIAAGANMLASVNWTSGGDPFDRTNPDWEDALKYLTNLRTLNLGNCGDMSAGLPDLPSGLTILYVQGTNLDALPALPGTLTNLIANDNNLTALPALPAGLRELQVQNNQIAGVLTVPSGCRLVDVANNELTFIDLRGASLAGVSGFNLYNNYFELGVVPPTVLTDWPESTWDLTPTPPAFFGASPYYYFGEQRLLPAYDHQVTWISGIPASIFESRKIDLSGVQVRPSVAGKDVGDIIWSAEGFSGSGFISYAGTLPVADSADLTSASGGPNSDPAILVWDIGTSFTLVATIPGAGPAGSDYVQKVNINIIEVVDPRAIGAVIGGVPVTNAMNTGIRNFAPSTAALNAATLLSGDVYSTNDNLITGLEIVWELVGGNTADAGIYGSHFVAFKDGTYQVQAIVKGGWYDDSIPGIVDAGPFGPWEITVDPIPHPVVAVTGVPLTWFNNGGVDLSNVQVGPLSLGLDASDIEWTWGALSGVSFVVPSLDPFWTPADPFYQSAAPWLVAVGIGTFELTATVAGYSETWTITVKQPVYGPMTDGINRGVRDVTEVAYLNTGTPLTGTVHDATGALLTGYEIVWSIDSAVSAADAIVAGGQFIGFTPGVYDVYAYVKDGWPDATNGLPIDTGLFGPFEITVPAVARWITGVPKTIFNEVDVDLSGVVVYPLGDFDVGDIEWTVENLAGAPGCFINSDPWADWSIPPILGTTEPYISAAPKFKAVGIDSFTLVATIPGAGLLGADYVQKFNIAATEEVSHVPSVAIQKVTPATADLYTPVTLGCEVHSLNNLLLTGFDVEWRLVAGTTGAFVFGNQFIAVVPGDYFIEARVKKGWATGDTDWFGPYKITVADPTVAVTGITGIPTQWVAGNPLNLYAAAVVEPATATNKTIVWSIENAWGNGTSLAPGYVMNSNPSNVGGIAVTQPESMNNLGKGVRLKAVITNGEGIGSDYVQYFDIRYFVPVTDIGNVPALADVSGGTVNVGSAAAISPAGAGRDIPYYPDWLTNPASLWHVYDTSDIVWSLVDGGGTGMVILANGDLDDTSFTMSGTITVRAAIAGASDLGGPYTQDFEIYVYVPVVGIDDFEPASAFVNQAVTLRADVDPAAAGIIEWSLSPLSAVTDVMIVGDRFIALETGLAKVRATVARGLDGTGDYWEDFEIMVYPVLTDILLDPLYVIIGNPAFDTLDLDARSTVVGGTPLTPIVWSEVSRTGLTDVAFTPSSSNIIDASAATIGGSITVEAKIVDGLGAGYDLVREFTIQVILPMTDLGFFPEVWTAGVPLVLSGFVYTLPGGATTTTPIVWTMVNAMGTDALISIDGMLRVSPESVLGAINAVGGGANHSRIYVKAYVEDGKGPGIPYEEVFEIYLIVPVTAIDGLAGNFVFPGNTLDLADLAEVQPAADPPAAPYGAGSAFADLNNWVSWTAADIVWSVDDNGTGVTIDPATGILDATGVGVTAGFATVTAIIPFGAGRNAGGYDDTTANWADFVYSFDVEVFVPVDSITLVPIYWNAGVPLNLGTLSWINNRAAANKKVISSWAITGTDFIEASMRGNTVYVTAESVLAAVASGRQAWTTVKLTATVENGAAPNQNYTQDFYVTFVVPVTGMTMDSAFVLAGNTKDINDFNPVVAPANAGWYEHTALGWVVWADGLEWSMVPGQDMAGAVSIDPVTGLIDATAATAAGTVKVRATIPGGAGRKSVGGEPGCNDFVDISFDFTVNVIVPLNDIIGIPAKWNAGKVLDLASVPYMDPPAAGFYATDIVWSIDPLGTDATISTAGKLNVSAASVIAAGTNEPDSWLAGATIKATVINGAGPNANFEKYFNISFIAPVTDIEMDDAYVLIDDAKDVNDFLPVVLPVNAGFADTPATWAAWTAADIVWTMEDDYGNDVTITAGGLLEAADTATPGVVDIRATIVGGGGVDWVAYSEVILDYSKVFSVKIIQSVIEIIDVPEEAFVNQALQLSGTVLPLDATVTGPIVWSVSAADAGTTGVIVTPDGKFIALTPGTATVTATIINGKWPGENFWQDFEIEVILPVTGIENVPEFVVLGNNLSLAGAVVVPNDTNIVWSVVSNNTNYVLDGDTLKATMTSRGGTITVRGTIANGWGLNNDAWYDFDIAVVVSVLNITNVPEFAVVGEVLALTGTVVPAAATEKTIVWSVSPDNTLVSALVDGDAFIANATGTATVRATVIGGKWPGENYWKDFEITVLAILSDIVLVNPSPAVLWAPDWVELAAELVPDGTGYDAANIVWTVDNAGTTGAVIEPGSNALDVLTAGTVTVLATLYTDAALATPVTTKIFTIEVYEVITDGSITSPLLIVANDPVQVTFDVVPATARILGVTYSVDDTLCPAGAMITADGVLFAYGPGSVDVTVTVVYGPNGESFDITETITVFTPVTDITLTIPALLARDTAFDLGAAVVVPSDATNQTIVWSGAGVTGDKFEVSVGGAYVVTATIANGRAPGVNFVKQFTINVYKAVTSIAVPSTPFQAAVGTALLLTGTAQPADATVTGPITWSVVNANGTGAVITGGNSFLATASGTATVRATIVNGDAQGVNYTQDFEVMVFQPVRNITGIPAFYVTGTPALALNSLAVVTPADATNKTIAWSVVNAYGTGASVTGGNFTATGRGTNNGIATIRATIANGLGTGIAYTQDFNIEVIVPVTGVTAPPAYAAVGVALTNLATQANPAGASYRNIVWSVSPASTAAVSGSTFIASAAGAYTLTATVKDGLGLGLDYVSEAFTITVITPVASVTGIPANWLTNDMLDLNAKAIVLPANATNKAIVWTVVSAGTTGIGAANSVIADGKLTATANGTATVRATIAGSTVSAAGVLQNTPAYDFTITFTSDAKEIVGLPSIAYVGVPLTITGSVNPSTTWTWNDVVLTIVDGGGTGAALAGNVLSATDGGTAKLLATIPGGGYPLGADFTQEFEILVICSVKDIYPVPDEPAHVTFNAILGQAFELNGTVLPANADKQTIVWTIAPAVAQGEGFSAADYSLVGNKLTASKAGSVVVIATIYDGLSTAPSTHYTKNFIVVVTDPTVPVTGITANVPGSVDAGDTKTFTGTVSPADATDQVIVWTMKNDGGTGATITADGKFTAGTPGTVIVTAAAGGYSKDYTIVVNAIAVVNPLDALSGLPNPVVIGKGFKKYNADVFEGYEGITWSAETNKMFSVDSRGKITFQKGFGSLFYGRKTVTASAAGFDPVTINVRVRWMWYEWFLVIFFLGALWI